MESSYVSEFADERKTFDRLLDSHFRRLELKAGSWEQERGILEGKIDQKNNELQEKQKRIAQLESRNTSSAGLEAVVRDKEVELDEKRGKIRELERELREARGVIAELREEEEARRRRALRPTADRSRENKENILGGAPKSLESDVTPPLKPNHPRPALVNASIQVDEPSNTKDVDEYATLKEWKERVTLAEENMVTCQNALEKLKERHRKDTEKWKKWVDEDTKRRLRKGSRAPRSSEAPASSPPPPPRIPPAEIVSDAESTRSGGLFSTTKPAVPSRFQGKTLGSDEGERRQTDRSSPLPETEEPKLPPPMSQPSKRTPMGDDDPNGDVTTEGSEADNQEDSPTPKAGKYIKPDPSRSPKTPVGTRARRITSGNGNKETPLVIKSEPDSDSSGRGPGYHLFDDDDDDLDLDDVPAPRQRAKKRKSQSQHKKASPKKASPKTKKAKAPLAVREEDEDHAPIPRAPQHQPEQEVTVFEDAAPAVESTRKTSTPYTNRRNAGNVSGAWTSSTGKAKRKRDTHDATASVLEDGTDADGNPYHHRNSPPDIVTSVKLKDLLSTPAPKPINLTHLKQPAKPAPTSEPPPKKRVVFTGETVITPSRNPKRDPKTDPSKPKPTISDLVSMGTSGYIPAPAKPAKKPLPTTTEMPAPAIPKPLAASDFRLNPLAHDGADFAFSEVVRGKEARKCLPGCTKACCRELSKFVSAAGLPVKSKGLQWRDEDTQEEAGDTQEQTEMFTDQYGKHRDRFGGRERSPLGFWDSEFPDTQKLEEQRRDADRREAEKVEKRRKEAEKGVGGKYVRR